MVGIDPNDSQVKKCIINQNTGLLFKCKKLTFKEAKKYYSGDGKPFMVGQHRIFPATVGKLKNKPIKGLSKIKVLSLKPTQKEISIPAGITYYIKVLQSHKILKIKHQDAITSKTVIYQSKIGKGFKLEANLPIVEKKGSDDEVKYDDRLLTSCITFLDSLFEGGAMAITGGGCEDSVNFIRSKGWVDEIVINDAPFDAIDMDFSKINVRETRVKNAGNDCLDVSAGYYNFSKLTLSNCNDKGVSVGERARVTINEIDAKNVETGVASKDSSKSYINLARFDNKSVDLCLDAYRKKQEYLGGELKVNRLNCHKIKNDSFSSIELNNKEICHHISEVNGIELCSKNDGLEMLYINPRPSKFNLLVKLNYKEKKSQISEIKFDELNSTENCSNKNCKFFIASDGLPVSYSLKEVSVDGWENMSELTVDLN